MLFIEIQTCCFDVHSAGTTYHQHRYLQRSNLHPPKQFRHTQSHLNCKEDEKKTAPPPSSHVLLPPILTRFSWTLLIQEVTLTHCPYSHSNRRYLDYMWNNATAQLSRYPQYRYQYSNISAQLDNKYNFWF